MYNDEIAKRQSMIEASYKQEVATKQKILEQAQQEETQKKQAQDDQERLQSLTDFSNTGFFKFFETVGKGIGDAGKWVTDKLGIDTSGIKQSAQAYEPTYERMIRGHADGTEYTTKGDILWNEKRPEVLSVESGLKVRQMDDYFNYDKVEQIVKENSSQPIQIIIQGATIREEQDIQKLSKSVAEELYKLQIKNDRAYKGV
jgi:hypothetical protein